MVPGENYTEGIGERLTLHDVVDQDIVILQNFRTIYIAHMKTIIRYE